MIELTPFVLPADTLLKRQATARALSASGFPITAATLKAKACCGEGPPYARWGRDALYRWGDALSWAQGRMQRAA